MDIKKIGVLSCGLLGSGIANGCASPCQGEGTALGW